MSLRLHVVLTICLLAGLIGANAERARYDNYRIYKVTASNVEEITFLRKLAGSGDSIKFLDLPNHIGKGQNVIVAPHKIPDFLELMRINEIDYKLLNSNVQALIEKDAIKNEIATFRSEYSWKKYHSLNATYKWMVSLTKKYPGVVSLIEAGKSYEKRTILGVKISNTKGKSSENRPGIYVEGGIHAREWISPSTATYLINQLLTSSDPAIKDLGQNYDWYIIPHANPDGYVYSQTTDRFWRKTRKPQGTCFGTDGNRNWDFHWNEVGTEDDPCSEIYAGPSAFSEIEMRSLSEYMKTLKGKIQMFLAFHSFSQVIMYPYGHTEVSVPNVKDFEQVLNVGLAAIQRRYGTKYTGGSIYKAVYPASGATIDWTYGVLGVNMTFEFELRPSEDEERYGFDLPANQIEPTVEETTDAIVAMVNEVKKLGYFN